jgi:hypothetical protein
MTQLKNKFTLSIKDPQIQKLYIMQNSFKVFLTLILLEALRTFKTAYAFIYAEKVSDAY